MNGTIALTVGHGWGDKMAERKMIYLDDAIDALERERTYSAVYKYSYTQTDYFKQYNMGLTDGIKALNKVPSAQREPLTDKEQRIFLAAMGREEKVCKQVDDEYRDCMEPYEDSLVRTCNEITRKVKGALWT